MNFPRKQEKSTQADSKHEKQSPETTTYHGAVTCDDLKRKVASLKQQERSSDDEKQERESGGDIKKPPVKKQQSSSTREDNDYNSPIDPVKLEERKSLTARLLGSVGNLSESRTSLEKADERRTLVARMMDTTRVRNNRRSDGCDSTIDTLSIDGLDCIDDEERFDEDQYTKSATRQFDRLPSEIKILDTPDKMGQHGWLEPRQAPPDDKHAVTAPSCCENVRRGQVAKNKPIGMSGEANTLSQSKLSLNSKREAVSPPGRDKPRIEHEAEGSDELGVQVSKLGFDGRRKFRAAVGAIMAANKLTVLGQEYYSKEYVEQLQRNHEIHRGVISPPEEIPCVQLNVIPPQPDARLGEMPARRAARSARRSSISNISVQLSVASDDQFTGGRRVARRSSVSTVSIQLAFDDESIDTTDQNAALLSLITQAVATATDDGCAVEMPATISPSPPSVADEMRRNDTIQRETSFMDTHDDATIKSHATTRSARQRRSTMSHSSAAQPPPSWRYGEPTADISSADQNKYGYGAPTTNAPTTAMSRGRSFGSCEQNIDLSQNDAFHHYSPEHKFGRQDRSSTGAGVNAYRSSVQESVVDQRRTLMETTTEAASQSIETSYSMHNIGLHDRYGFMVNDKQAKRNRRNSLSWRSTAASEGEKEDLALVTSTKTSGRPSLSRSASTVINPASMESTRNMRSSGHSESTRNMRSSGHSARAPPPRQLSRGGGLPPSSRSASSRSLLNRRQMVRQTSTKSISRTSVVSNDNQSSQKGQRPSLLARSHSSRSISKMTVVYQQTTEEDSYCDMSTSDLGDSVAEFGEAMVSVEEEDNSIMDCMSRIDEPILEYEATKDPPATLQFRAPSTRSLYSLKSIKSLGKKLGLSRKKKKSKAPVPDEQPSETMTQPHESPPKAPPRTISSILSFKFGRRKMATPEPWMMLQSNEKPWEDHEDSRMLTLGEQLDEKRMRRMQRRASM